jgi:stress-induced morphogen
MTRAQRMEAVLQAAFSPASLEIVDESAMHAGHAGARPGGETHYQVTMVADTFEGLSRVDRQRRVNEVLATEFDGGLHALSLRLKAPSEAT